MSSTDGVSPVRAHQASVTEISMATMGVLLRKAEKRAVGTHRRTIALTCPLGLPSRGRTTSSTARVSSIALAKTNSPPIARIDGEENLHSVRTNAGAPVGRSHLVQFCESEGRPSASCVAYPSHACSDVMRRLFDSGPGATTRTTVE